MESLTIGVIGNGFVGKATQIYARASTVKCLVYDIDPTKCSPAGITYADLATQCDIVFVCVPTPMNVDTGCCDVSIVSRVVDDITSAASAAPPIIVVRSTVPPNTCNALGVCHMPEFLTEAQWERDFIQTTRWYLGAPCNQRDRASKLIASLLCACKSAGVIVSDDLVVAHPSVTETAKYFRNAMLAVRVGVCNEFAQFTRALGINYEDVRVILAEDPRIGSAHTAVPGPDGCFGFGGTCLPKDLSGLICAMKNVGMDSVVLSAVQHRNNTVDRAGKQEWLTAVGRAVSASAKKD